MKTALIITTYNRPDALAAVLFSALRQRTLPAEILIADDGSGAETKAVIAQIAAQSPIPIHHIWQPDQGFRLAESRNRAINATHCDHLIMIDGDMLLHPDFVAEHRAVIAPNRFIQGSRVLLTPEFTAELLATPRAEVPSLAWHHRGIMKRLAALHLPRLAALLARRGSQQFKGIKGCNMAFWRADAARVNGFNQDFQGWGREDSEFVARLYHSGIRRHNLKFAGIGYHLWHEEAARAALPANDALLAKTLHDRATFCRNGLEWRE